MAPPWTLAGRCRFRSRQAAPGDLAAGFTVLPGPVGPNREAVSWPPLY